ncbi:hypothetical protein CFOL_v3_00069 [Cephalotus follicularis]|uniref:Bifunctional inhibitor/plant lipid transfer protein/seed storage helical domain-containing protein n=1 Tax=Cephalotus follicularis TaxID=3775 RepID=A0A1Q3AL92_CEPFO|nr:hypothetical protein CFOL_v3_00069 [Cephalotus follicularis]
MAAHSMTVKLACVMVMCMVVGAPSALAKEQPSIQYCVNLISQVLPCLGYLAGGDLGPGCCPIVTKLYNEAKTTAILQKDCVCAKSFLNSLGINYSTAFNLTKLCKLKNFHITSFGPNTDCSKLVN